MGNGKVRGQVRIRDPVMLLQIPAELQHSGFEKKVYILDKYYVVLGRRQAKPQGR